MKMVVFFGAPAPPDGKIQYGGTGFLANYECDNKTYSYLLTCRHVAKALGSHVEFLIRVNLREGGFEEIPVPTVDWFFHENPSVDLAIASTRGIFDENKHDVLAVSLNPANDYSADAKCGDQISLVGLFRLRAGSKRNMPIVHTGHIASLADPQELVPCTNRETQKVEFCDVHLIEAQTLEGLSGSPVFVRQAKDIKVQGADGSSDSVSGFGSVDLFGIYQGSWDGRPGELLEQDRSFVGELRVPVGVGMVVPIAKAREVIEKYPDLIKQRERFDKLYRLEHL
jgi:hypothetical protein